MFMRFVRIPVRPEAIEAYTSFYNFRVAPTLNQVKGCLFARLIQDTSDGSGLLSFTVWDSPESAHEYEQSGLFDQLIAENEPFAEDRTEWKIQLSEDMKLEYKPVIEPPDVREMPVVAGTKDGDPAEQIGDFTYVRVLSAKLRPETIDEAHKVYDEQIAPEVMKVKGCRGVYLIALNNEGDVLSVTVWENERDAKAYEASGKFREMNMIAGPYLSSLLQWKMSLDPEKQSETLTSEDEIVKGYHIITGKPAA